MKSVAFLIAGQMRSDAFQSDGDSHSVLEHFKKAIFNEELQQNYTYDVFMHTDTAKEEHVKNFFAGHDVTIQCEMDPVVRNDFDYSNSQPCYNVKNLLTMFYRLQKCWQMMTKEYDYAVRLRPDVEYSGNLVESLRELDANEEHQMFTVWDVGYVGRYDLMKTVCNHYDTLYRSISRKNVFEPVFGSYRRSRQDVTLASEVHIPEFQLSECIMQYFEKHGIRLDRIAPSKMFARSITWKPGHYAGHGYN